MIINNLDELDEFAKNFANELKPFDLVILEGDLGAGKTQLTKMLCKHLAVKEQITSPTFPIVNSYEAKYKIFHFDVYRLESKHELQNIGFDDYLNEEAIIFIEWGSKFMELMPEDSILIRIEITGETSRRIKIDK